jgi:predicted nucleic-acid-binding protein
MITLDTNILVRLLVEDDPEQVEKARGVLARCSATGERCFIPVPVLCEVLWVLRRAYKVPKAELVEVVRNLLREDLYALEHPESVSTALERFERGRGDFADYLIEARGRAHDSTVVLTFDQGMEGEAGFQVL